MPESKSEANPAAVRANLSAFWLFVLLNYLYCDIMTHMDSEALNALLTGTVGNLKLTQGFLLGASVYMEIPIAMTLLSRFLPFQAARWASVGAGLLMTAGQGGSLFAGTGPTPYYIFYSIVEMAGTLFIAWYAWRHPSTGTTPAKML